MTRLGRWTVILILAVLTLPTVMQAGEGSAHTVYILPIKGEIDPGLARFVERATGEARFMGAQAILVEVSTLGGRLDATLDIYDSLVNAGMPVHVLIEDRAWSAGVLISLSGEQLLMMPGTSIGAAEPRPFDEKTLSAWRGELEAAAERVDRDPQLVAAMADATMSIPDVVEKGKLLTLTARQAHELGFADDIVSSRSEALEVLGFLGAGLVEGELTSSESLSRFVTNSTIAPMLLTLGFMGLLVEITTPGLGVPGIAGLVFLALFFGGHMIAGIAGMGAVLLFLLGLILLAVEAIMPGFGVFGLGGIITMAFSLYFTAGGDAHAARTLTLGLLGTAVLGGVFIALAVRFKWLRRFGLPVTLSTALGYVSTSSDPSMVGKLGETITVLRPSGTAIIEDERYDVVSEGGFINKGTRIRVTKVEGRRIVVRAIGEQDI